MNDRRIAQLMEGLDLQAQAGQLSQKSRNLIILATHSGMVPFVTYDKLENISKLPRAVISLGATWCIQCALLLPKLEEINESVLTVRHDLDTYTGINEDQTAYVTALDLWPDDNAPPSKSGRTKSEIPVTIYFEHGVEVRRAYGSDVDLNKLTERVALQEPATCHTP